MNSNDSTSLYGLIGLHDLATTEEIRHRLDELQIRYGRGLDQNLNPDLAHSLRTAVKILQVPESRQRYNMLLRAQQASDPTLPRLGDEESGRQILALASLVGIELEQICELTYQIKQAPEVKSNDIPPGESLHIQIGSKNIEFTSVGFGVEPSFRGHATRIVLRNKTTISLDVNIPLTLDPAHDGTLIFVTLKELGPRKLIAACANHTLQTSVYVEQAARQLFDANLSEVGRFFEVRAKASRVRSIVIEFHKHLAQFAQKCSPDFNQNLNEEALISYIKKSPNLLP